MSKCTVEKCSNSRFQMLEQCAFHCNGKDIIKKGYDPTTYAKDFYRLFSEYIIEEVGKALPTTLSKEDREDSSEINNLDRDLDLYSQFTGGVPKTVIDKELSDRLRKIHIEIKGLDFPSNDKIKISYETISVLTSIGKLTISDSIIYFKNFNIDTNIYYNNCEFKNNVLINPFPNISSSETYRYIKCLFKQRVNVESINDLDTMYSNIFENCIFNNGFLVKDLIIKKQLIKFPDYLVAFDGLINKGRKRDFYKKIRKGIASYSLLKVVLEGCTIEEDLKLNGLSDGDIKVLAERGVNIESKDFILKNLIIKDTKFQSKIEIKNRVIKRLYFENSNIEKVFDAFESKFEKSYFYKSIFNDFSGFEKVVFGVEGKDTEEYQAKFIYTTFMSFSNFRSTIFLSGLDFENANLKEQPNFLKTKISPKNTNRETFRIIKNSFDDAGNNIEANKFFVEEMKAYKKELYDIKFKEAECIRKIKEVDKSEKFKRHKKTKDYKDFRRARWVFNANNFISEFGENYLRPTFILTISVIVYTVITLWNKHYFKKHPYFTSWDWLNNASWSQWYFDSHDYFMSWKWFDTTSSVFNEFAINILPFRVFIKDRNGIEFISLFFYIWFAVLIWQIIVSVKRHTQR